MCFQLDCVEILLIFFYCNNTCSVVLIQQLVRLSIHAAYNPTTDDQSDHRTCTLDQKQVYKQENTMGKERGKNKSRLKKQITN